MTAKGSHQHNDAGAAHVPDRTLALRRITIERKTFTLRLKENGRGLYLAIREQAEGCKAAIVVPASGLPLFAKILDKMLQTSEPDNGENDFEPVPDSPG